MKLVINYDFFNAILDANEGFSAMKLYRNNKKLMLIMNSAWFAINYLCLNERDVASSLRFLLYNNCGFMLGFYIANHLFDNVDIYANEANLRLEKLANDLKNIYVDTNHNLLLQSELLSRKYKVQLNKKMIPELMEYKYILVPTNINNYTKNVCIEQEHVIGTNDYVLSVGSPQKKLKLEYDRV